MKKKNDIMYIVSIDTRHLPSSDLLEGYEEITCPREEFEEIIRRNADHARCVTCKVAEACGLDKHLKIYFFEAVLGYTSGSLLGRYWDCCSSSSREVLLQDAWSDFFPMGENNPAASLLTFDPWTGFAKYNIQGMAYAVYDDGRYPLSKEQVWGIQELANEAKDVYFFDDEHARRGWDLLMRWCEQYKRREWGPRSSIYEPREREDEDEDIVRSAPRRLNVLFSQTCLI